MSDNSPQSSWPAHFPTESCPPSDANDLDGRVLYLVNADPPTAEDFKCATDRGTFVGQCECLRASLSCGLTESYMNGLRKAVARLASLRIAEAWLAAEHGKIQKTRGPGHYSIWLTAESLENAPQLFAVIE